MKTLIHDCDPGQDDAIALMINLRSAHYKMTGVTVVGGNVGVKKCAINARRILGLCGYSDIPVYNGAAKPLNRKLVTLEDVFGESGMAGGDDLPDPCPNKENPNAVSYLVEVLSGATNPVAICATGPLTNVALALQREPLIAKSVERLVIMGGCVFPEPLRGEMGNINVEGTRGKAEYNFAMDPEAAAIVFSSDIRLVGLVGLNVTRKVLFNSRWQKALYDLPNQVAQKAADILSIVGADDVKDYGHLRQTANDPVRAIHDAVAAVYLDKPEIFDIQRMHVKIITGMPPAIAGQSLPAKLGDASASQFPVEVAVDCDPDEVFRAIMDRLSTYNSKSRRSSLAL